MCGAYCTHGGVCVLKMGHEGQHDSYYCKWGDEESLTKLEADAKLQAKAEELGYSQDEIEFMKRYT